MKLPSIHNNGTSREELQRQNYEARHALKLAISALGADPPHGRDYYPQGEHAIFDALEQHANRMLSLRGVLSELETIAEHLA